MRYFGSVSTCRGDNIYESRWNWAQKNCTVGSSLHAKFGRDWLVKMLGTVQAPPKFKIW